MTSFGPKCLLFDLDGTLLDSLPGIDFSVKAAFRACGLTMEQHDLRSLIGPPIRTILSLLSGLSSNCQLDSLETAFRSSYDSEGWCKTICFPGVEDVLRAASTEGRRLFVVSNKPRVISLRILEHLRIRDCFELILTRDSRVPPFSGKTEMIETLLAEMHLPGSDCVFVGDTIEDAIAAATARVHFAFVTYGYGCAGEVQAMAGSRKLDDLRQLIAVHGGCL